jgi:hypothetical protein
MPITYISTLGYLQYQTSETTKAPQPPSQPELPHNLNSLTTSTHPQPQRTHNHKSLPFLQPFPLGFFFSFGPHHKPRLSLPHYLPIRHQFTRSIIIMSIGPPVMASICRCVERRISQSGAAFPGYRTEPNGPAGIRPRPALLFGAPLALWSGRTVDGPVAGLGCSEALESPRRSPRGSCRPLIVSGTQCYSTQPPSTVESISF